MYPLEAIYRGERHIATVFAHYAHSLGTVLMETQVGSSRERRIMLEHYNPPIWQAPALTPRWFTPRSASDHLFALAIITLPVDGTVLGFFQPFWTPISPWLLLAYCLANPRLLWRAMHHYTPFMALPVMLIILSVPGWAVFGVHANAIVMSLTGVIAVPATLAALDIAFASKHLNWSESIRLVIAAYWFAFAVGVVQWLAIRLDIRNVLGFFRRLMYRPYIYTGYSWGTSGGRPQFLFAEPSYIGMHLFGILLPLFWLVRTHDSIYAKRLKHLIVVFAIGSVIMGSGTRIVLDSLVALIAVIIVETRWHEVHSLRRGVMRLAGVVLLVAASVMANSRLDSILNNGVEGDGSFFMRIWQSLLPLCGMAEHPWTLLTGFGAGNLNAAVQQGTALTVRMLTAVGVNPVSAARWAPTMTPDTVWTMCAYTNFIVEFGLIGFTLFIVTLLRFITRRHRWCKLTIVWLTLIAYLYIQFEGYAFAALPLMIWALTSRSGLSRQPS